MSEENGEGPRERLAVEWGQAQSERKTAISAQLGKEHFRHSRQSPGIPLDMRERAGYNSNGYRVSRGCAGRSEGTSLVVLIFIGILVPVRVASMTRAKRWAFLGASLRLRASMVSYDTARWTMKGKQG